MSFVAGRTETMRIVSSVMIVPHRNPVFNAKALATIDVLSEGRLIVGIGVGWMAEEFKALSAADFKHRGAVTDEYVGIFKAQNLIIARRPPVDFMRSSAGLDMGREGPLADWAQSQPASRL